MTAAGLRNVDTNVKLARSMDGTVNALTAVQIAAGYAGVSVGEANTSMQTLNRELASATEEGSPAAKALERLGMNAAALSALDTDDRMAAIADRVKELGLSSSQASDILRDLGVRSRNMALLMIQGGDAIRSAREEVTAFGLELTEAQTKGIEDANDAVARMSLVFQGLSQMLAAEVAPVLLDVANKFNEFATSDAAREGIAKIVEAFGSLIEIVGSDEFLSTALGAFEGLISFTAGAASGLVFVAQNLELVTAAAVVATGVLAVMGGPITLAVAAATLAVAGISILVGRIRDTFGSVGEALSLVGDVVAEVFDRMSMKAGAWSAGLSATVQDVNSAFFGMVGAIAESVASAVGAVTSGVAAMINAAISGFETLINKAVQGVNSLVAGLNKIPGIAIEALSPFSAGGGVDFSGATSGIDAISERISGMKAEAGASAEALRGLAGQLTDMSGAPLASMEALRAAMSVDTGQSPGPDDGSRDPLVVTPIIPGVPITPTAPGTGTGGGGGGGPTAGVGGAGAVTDEMQARLDALTQGMMTEAETVQEWYQAGDETLREALDAELITRAEYDEQKLRLEAEHLEKIAGLQGDASKAEIEMRKNTIGSVLGLMQMFGQKNKILAKAAVAINAAQRVAEIQANTAAASVRALAELGPIAGPPAAARIAAYGAIQTGIAIASAAMNMSSPSGSGGGGGGGSAGGASAATAPPQAPLEARVTGFGPNDLFNGSMVTSLFDKLQDEAGDRGLRVSFAT
jgi:hypothetical protein